MQNFIRQENRPDGMGLAAAKDDATRQFVLLAKEKAKHRIDRRNQHVASAGRLSNAG